MDDLSFDQLVKRLSAQRTRRTSLRALAGGALAAIALTDTSTDAKKRKKKCKAPKVKCGRKLCCAAGQQCDSGACVTPTTTTTIPGGCTSACDAGQECTDAQCVCKTALCNAATNPIQGETLCFCAEDFSGESLCFANQSCATPLPVSCGVNGSCPQGFICLADGCGGNPTCFKTCV